MAFSIASRVSALALLALLAPIAAPSWAQDQGDPANGRRLAEAWCVNCHVLDSSRQAVSTGAPTFASIAAARQVTPLSLQVFLRTPHERMPDLHLTNIEIDDLIAFILAPRGR